MQAFFRLYFWIDYKSNICCSTGPEHFDEYKKDASNHFFITNEEGCSYRTMFETYLLKHDLYNFQTMELWSIEAIKKMVMSGMGFAVLLYITVKEEVESGKLKMIIHNEKFEHMYSHMLIKKKKWLSPAGSICGICIGFD
jgi:DNA-binding transcriptional LysR family regulator